MQQHFRPEFVNRVDEFIVFQGLDSTQIRSIVALQARPSDRHQTNSKSSADSHYRSLQAWKGPSLLLDPMTASSDAAGHCWWLRVRPRVGLPLQMKRVPDVVWIVRKYLLLRPSPSTSGLQSECRRGLAFAFSLRLLHQGSRRTETRPLTPLPDSLLFVLNFQKCSRALPCDWSPPQHAQACTTEAPLLHLPAGPGPLGTGMIPSILGHLFRLRQQVQRVQERLADKDVSLFLTDEALQFLADRGFDPAFGARPVKRAVQRELESQLAKARALAVSQALVASLGERKL